MAIFVVFLQSQLFVSSKHAKVSGTTQLKRHWHVSLLQTKIGLLLNRTQRSCQAIEFQVPGSGFGSNIFVFGEKMLAGALRDVSVHWPLHWTSSRFPAHWKTAHWLVGTQWGWADNTLCEGNSTGLECFVGKLAYPCPSGAMQDPQILSIREERVLGAAYPRDRNERLSHVIEYMFRQVPERILENARSANFDVFGAKGSPPDMITVHIRWGDKGAEAHVAPMGMYIQAVESMVLKHHMNSVTVFVSTEDAKALSAFQVEARARGWMVRWLPSAVAENADVIGVGVMDRGAQLALPSILSLLLGLEARYFVLTTSSNWSRLLDALRRLRLDAECGNCTDYIDVCNHTLTCAPAAAWHA
jgi:hypothetical protein